MPTTEHDLDAARRQLERVLASAGFSRNQRMARFLRFVVEQHLEGKDSEIKESVIAIEVFGRGADHDPKQNSIVRNEAARLRARLSEYYVGEGRRDTLVIELPKGGYVPVVRVTAQTRESIAPGPEGAPPPLASWRLALLVIAGLAVLLAAVGWMRLGPGRRPPLTANRAAHDLYLRARASAMRPAVKGVQDSLDLFEQAIAKDPSFAPAYAGVAAMEAARSHSIDSTSERADMIAKGWAAANKAIQLDPRLADAHDALGMMQARQAQWEQGEHSFRRAIELAPRDPLWRVHFAMFLLLPLGRIEEAIVQLQSAEVFDPRSLEAQHALYLAYRAVGRFDDAHHHCEKAAEDDQQSSVCWAETLLRQGKTDEAVRMLEVEWNGHMLEMDAHSLGVAYAQAGRREDAERVAALAPRPASKALIFAAMGDKDRTLEALDQMIPMGPTRIGRFLISPDFAFLRGDPRLAEIRKKVGLPE